MEIIYFVLQKVELSVHLNIHWIDFLPHTLSEVTAKQRKHANTFSLCMTKFWLFFKNKMQKKKHISKSFV